MTFEKKKKIQLFVKEHCNQFKFISNRIQIFINVLLLPTYSSIGILTLSYDVSRMILFCFYYIIQHSALKMEK